MLDVKHCDGCYDDVYNHGCGGAKTCWGRNKGTVIKRYAIGTWTAPTEHGAYTEMHVPSCYHKPGTHYHDKLPSFVKASDVNRANRAVKPA